MSETYGELSVYDDAGEIVETGNVPLEYDSGEQYGELAGWEGYYDAHPDGYLLEARGGVAEALATAESLFDIISPATQNWLMSLRDSSGQPVILHPKIIALAYDVAAELSAGSPPSKSLHGGGGMLSQITQLTAEQDAAQRSGDIRRAQQLHAEIMRLAGG